MEPKSSETAATQGDKDQKTNTILMQIWIKIEPPRIEQRGLISPYVQKHGRAGFPLGARRDSRSAGSIIPNSVK